MSTRDIDTLKSELLKNRIELSDTMSQFVEKCNNNFSAIIEWGGGPAGEKGEYGDPGVPTKPKVPIHVWREGIEYDGETHISNDEYVINNIYEKLSDVKYQDGHLIMLKNAHVYILESDNFELKPKYILGLQSLNPGDIINGKNSYMHIAYANTPNSIDGFITDQQLRGEYNNSYMENKPYMGVYSDNNQNSSTTPSRYTWVKIQGGIGLQGEQGIQGEKGDKGDKGEKGDKGDSFTGHPYTIDIEGDMSTISITSIDRTVMYKDDFCKCVLHAYYGNDNIKLNVDDVTVNLPEEYKNHYKYTNDGYIISISDNTQIIGQIIKVQSGNDVIIKFIPDDKFYFPKNTIIFQINISTTVLDQDAYEEYHFDRNVVWMIKGITSSFELEILPQYRTIKLTEDGKYIPEKLSVSVFKIEDGERELFDLKENTSFQLLYKNLNTNDWTEYTEDLNTKDASCFEFKIVDENEEIWDYEDVWVVADGKNAHYYHADLGDAESMMVLTTGEIENIGTKDNELLCAKLKDENGYSITFNPNFYDGTDTITVTRVDIGTNSGEEYFSDGRFEREFNTDSNTLTITKIPYGVDVIPMTFIVTAENNQKDIVSFNVYISTTPNIYKLVPTTSAFNTSSGKDGVDKIGCNVYKNNECIPTSELDQNALLLKYIVHDGSASINYEESKKYTEPIVYGDDNDSDKDCFSADDVAIEFILYYREKEIAKSTVPLIKDGIDGKDGDFWQYIFCRSSKYPFSETEFSNPAEWEDDKPNDSNNELLYDKENWYDDHKGVDSEYRYEYQSYRKWDKENKCWGKYGEPTLYSNYSEDGKNGNTYSIILSNPISTIPVGGTENDWKVEENFANQEDYTFVYLYKNSEDISSNNNLRLSLSLPEQYNKNFNWSRTSENNNIYKITFKPKVNDIIFDFRSNSPYKLPITLEYIDENGDKFESTVNWTLSPIKGLNDVEVFVDKRVINTSVSENHTIRVGYYLTTTDGNKKFIENKNNIYNLNLKYQIILTNDIGDSSSLSSDNFINNWENVDYNFSTYGENCYVVLVDTKNNNTIVDFTNITAVNDGKSAIHLELTQDYISLPSNNEKKVHDDYNVSENPIYSKMILYNGDTIINDGIEYSFKVNGKIFTKNNITDGFYLETDDKGNFTGGFDVNKDLITGDTNIECTATYNGTPYHKTLFIDLEETPYELELNTDILTRDVNLGKITTENILVRVKYWMNGKWTYTRKGVVKLSTSNSGEIFEFSGVPESVPEDDEYNYIRRFDIVNSTLETNNVDTEVRISYYIDDNNTQEISYETIGIINSGKDGSVPSYESVEIIGYSLNKDEDPDKEDNWVKNIYDLKTEDGSPIPPGAPIYILNKTIYNENGTEKEVKSITVTLAGTQGSNGSDGKSRVLFYLGSYQDGTLLENGPNLYGNLNDDRCDYYIDKDGTAWMRIGSEGSFRGYPYGSKNNKTYWKESEKVGFLKAGAIHADMINANSITANSSLVNTLFAQDVTAEKLKVNAANIIGKLTIGSGDNAQIEESAIKTVIGNTEIDGGKITTNSITANQIAAGAITANEIAAGAITADNIAAGAITADKIKSDSITADKINTKDLKVGELNTTEGAFKEGTINIQNNDIKIFNKEYFSEVIRITGDKLKTKYTSNTNKNIPYEESFIYNDEYGTNKFPDDSPSFKYDASESKRSWVWSDDIVITNLDIPNDDCSYYLKTDELQNNIYLVLNTQENENENRFGIKVYSYIYINEGDSIQDINIIDENYKYIDTDTFEDSSLKRMAFTFDTDNKKYTWRLGQGSGAITTKYFKVLNRFTGNKTYKLRFKYYIEIIDYNKDLTENKCPINFEAFRHNGNSETIYRDISKCELSSYGFRYTSDDDVYVEFNSLGEFTIQNKSNKLIVKNDGVYIGLDGTNPTKINSKKITTSDGKTFNVLGYT